ncbi:LuxR family transcriptional regulator [Modestobacter lapidis]|nr:LuxR family transcriptional regulator [Modestobacter lapidis]
MTAAPGLRAAAWTTPLPAGAGQLLQDARGGGSQLSAVAVQGPGGTGKSLLLTRLASAYREAGIPVADARSAPAAADLTGDLAVIVDDAQRLTPAGAERVRQLLAHPRARVTLAYRPWPRPPVLADLVSEMAGDRHMVVLGHLTREGVQTWATAELGVTVTPRLVDFVLHQTGGLPALVAALLSCLARNVVAPATAPLTGPIDPVAPRRLEVPGEVLEQVRADLAALDDEERALLHALAAGSPLDTEVLADLLELPAGRAGELVTRARAGGLLLAAGAVVPLVSDALLQVTPADVTRGTRRRLLGLLLDRGEDPLDLARALAADRVREPRAARLLEKHGTAALTVAPGLAGELLAEAAGAGAPPGRLAARRAQAAALTGDLDGALQWADTGLTDEEAPDRGRAAGVAATVLAQRGLLARSAELFGLAGPERAGSTALALLATGAHAEAVAVLQAARDDPAGSAPTTLSGGEWLMAQGVLRSLRCGASAADDIAASLSVLTRAAALVEPVGRTALLLDTPAALAALVALHSGELGVAESVLHRALDAEVGGPPARPRHLLLLAWTAMLRGRIGGARELMDRAHGTDRLEPRDELFLRALEVGLARRSSDSPALLAAWEPAREALLRHPVDLFALLPLGELVIAGSRMKDAGRLAPHLAEARALLARLGNPQLWATPLHWSGVQAAILTDDPAALEPHAAALAAAARTSPYAATVAQAGRSWLRVLTGDVDAATAVTAATDLAAVGLAWDGSRLAGQAAARATDPRDRLTLLQCARSLAESEEGGERTARSAVPEHAVPAGPEDAHLSQRERDVAALVVAGQTYREIGARLFISAKTVEHHVSRMRQRLGANSRSDLIARLQAELAEHG